MPQSSAWIKCGIKVSKTETLWIQIYANNHTDTPLDKRDVYFSFHATEGESGLYDNPQSAKKYFTLDMDSSNPNESELNFGEAHQLQIKTDHRHS